MESKLNGNGQTVTDWFYDFTAMLAAVDPENDVGSIRKSSRFVAFPDFVLERPVANGTPFGLSAVGGKVLAGFPQLLLRLGFGPEVKPTPRRSAQEVIIR